MRKFKKIIICGILSVILCLTCVYMPKANINSIGTEILNDNNITYYYEFNQLTFVNEITSGVGLYINYLDYLNFYTYARQLTYTNYLDNSVYVLFSYTFIDENLDEWSMSAFIIRTYDETISDYEYEMLFHYNLPDLGVGEDYLITSNGINSNSLLYGLLSNLITGYNLTLQQINLLKTVCINFFSDNNYVADVELTPNTNVPLGTQNNIVKNLFSSFPFTQGSVAKSAYFYDFNNRLIEIRNVSNNFQWVNVGFVNSNMPSLGNNAQYYFIEWEYSRDVDDTVHNSFISITQGDENIYFYPKYVDTTLNGTYTSNGYFTLGNYGQTPIEIFDTEINFTSNGQQFSRMKFSYNNTTYYLYYDNLLVGYQSITSNDYIHWTNLNYSNITFNNSYSNDLNAYYFITRNFYEGSVNFSNVNGYYYFNEKPLGTNSNNNTIRFLFVSNGILYNRLTILENGSILYDGDLVYNGETETWVNDKFRLININNTQIEEEQKEILLANGVFSYIDVNGDYDFTDILFSVADIPVRIMSQLLDVSIFGVSLFTALCGIITMLLVVFVIKKFL